MAITISAVPVILPVFYIVVDESVVFRTAPGTKLTAATTDTVVAFEADRFDPTSGRGWSVVIQGTAHTVTDPNTLPRLHARALPTLVEAETSNNSVQIPAQANSGRLIHASGQPNGPT